MVHRCWRGTRVSSDPPHRYATRLTVTRAERLAAGLRARIVAFWMRRARSLAIARRWAHTPHRCLPDLGRSIRAGVEPQQSHKRSVTHDRPVGGAHASIDAAESLDLNVLLADTGNPRP